MKLGAEHPNICRLEIKCLMEGAEHRNIPLVTVLCTFKSANSILSTNIRVTYLIFNLLPAYQCYRVAHLFENKYYDINDFNVKHPIRNKKSENNWTK